MSIVFGAWIVFLVYLCYGRFISEADRSISKVQIKSGKLAGYSLPGEHLGFPLGR